MRYLLVLAVVLAGCTLGGGRVDRPAAVDNPIVGDEIAVTALDAGPSVKASGDTAAKAPVQPVEAVAAPANPKTPKPPSEAAVALPAATPQELDCRKNGGQWQAVENGSVMICLHRTKDSGKSCSRKGDCEGDCLARSNTCAPFSPLFGCNDVFQDDGSMVTQCID